MKKSLFLFIPLMVMLLATVGSAEKAKKAQPSKTTAAIQIKPVEAHQSQVQPVPAAPKAGEEINWQVISQGGTDGGSASYQVGGTVTQTAVGYGSSASYQLSQGFWQSFEEEIYVCGDCNGDKVTNIADVVCKANYVFMGYSLPCPSEVVDHNGDGFVNVADIVAEINYLFLGYTLECPLLK
jgi:hypothetical protein